MLLCSLNYLERKMLPIPAVACPFITVAAREQKSILFLLACLCESGVLYSCKWKLWSTSAKELEGT